MAFKKSGGAKEKVDFEIVNVNKELPVYNGHNKTTNKPYTVYAIEADAIVNGNEETIRIKTMSKVVAEMFNVGMKGTGDKSEFNGVWEIFVPKDGVAGGASSGSSGGGSAPRVAYTGEEYDSLLAHAVKVCATLCTMNKLPVEEVSKLICTYMIGATQNGIKFGSAPTSTMNKPMESVLLKEINKAISKFDLDETIQAKDISNADVIKIWNDCDCIPEAFAEAIKEA